MTALALDLGRGITGTLPGVSVGPLADDIPILVIELPLPPPDNMCQRSGQYHRYVTAEYRDWLDICGPMVRAALPGWEPDTERWWEVSGKLWFGPRTRGDGPNYIKPSLDLLTGARGAKKGEPDPRTGEPIGPSGVGRIIKPGLFWNDDRRVHLGFWRVIGTHHAEPTLELTVVPDAPPLRAEKAKARR